MKTTIDINEYLTPEEIKEACVDAVKSAALTSIKEESDVKRIICNASYDLVYKKVDEFFDEDIHTVLATKVKKIVSELTSYTIFKKPSAWDREPNNAYKYLQKSIASNFPRITEIVGDNIEDQTLLMLKESMKDFIVDAVQNLFVKTGEKK